MKKPETIAEANKRCAEEVERIFEQMHDVLVMKAADYDGDNLRYTNLRAVEAMGIPAYKGALIRMTDKMSRLQSLAKSQAAPAVTGETFEDTLIDLANYAVICLTLYRETQS